jgi:hypothetical protein
LFTSRQSFDVTLDKEWRTSLDECLDRNALFVRLFAVCSDREQYAFAGRFLQSENMVKKKSDPPKGGKKSGRCEKFVCFASRNVFVLVLQHSPQSTVVNMDNPDLKRRFAKSANCTNEHSVFLYQLQSPSSFRPIKMAVVSSRTAIYLSHPYFSVHNLLQIRIFCKLFVGTVSIIF